MARITLPLIQDIIDMGMKYVKAGDIVGANVMEQSAKRMISEGGFRDHSGIAKAYEGFQEAFKDLRMKRTDAYVSSPERKTVNLDEEITPKELAALRETPQIECFYELRNAVKTGLGYPDDSDEDNSWEQVYDSHGAKF